MMAEVMGGGKTRQQLLNRHADRYFCITCGLYNRNICNQPVPPLLKHGATDQWTVMHADCYFDFVWCEYL